MAWWSRIWTIKQHLGTLLCPKHHFMAFPDHSRPVWDFCMTIPVYFPCKSWMAGTLTPVRIPGVMKKFDQNANFQNCDQGVEMLFSVTFRDIPKIDNHGSNSHLAPNVCFGNDTFF